MADLLRDAVGDRASDVTALTSALAGTGSTGVRAECAAALGDIGPAARVVVPALFTALQDPSEAVRASAARALTAIGPGAEDVPRLVAALGSSDPYVAAFAAWSLGNLGSAAQAAVPDLARAARPRRHERGGGRGAGADRPRGRRGGHRPRRRAAQCRRRPPLASGADTRSDRPAGRSPVPSLTAALCRPEQPSCGCTPAAPSAGPVSPRARRPRRCRVRPGTGSKGRRGSAPGAQAATLARESRPADSSGPGQPESLGMTRAIGVPGMTRATGVPRNDKGIGVPRNDKGQPEPSD